MVKLLTAALAGLWLVGWLRGAPYAPPREPAKVVVEREDWHDQVRDRNVPVKLYRPATEGARPVVLLSHGLGGSREVGTFIADHLARHGYLVIAMQHVGSDESIWRGRGGFNVETLRAGATGEQYLNRVNDVKFVLDRLERLSRDDERWKGRLDLDRIAIAGHSFGAQTTLAIAGVVSVVGRLEVSLADPRVKCAVAYSPSSPERARDLDRTWAKVRIPILHMTGTKDVAALGPQDWKLRRIPFDHIRAAGQYLVIFEGGDHLVYSGRRAGRGEGSKDERFHSLICQATLAFLDGYLLQDAAARRWLDDGGLAAELGADGRVERK